ncbi:hypothetical protein [Amycolatopsis lurida]|uniref:hypothetical protein n=1 Tax=Amycolatopsis lurida TaxID=31959 RepID=UPI003654BC07
MNELTSVVALQARLYEFLERQSETTLQAILRGEARLAVVRADDEQVSALAPAPVVLLPSDDPELVAQELSKAAPVDQRRILLRATGLSMSGLRRVAKLRGVRGYSSLTKARLIDLLASSGTSVEQPGTPRKRRQAEVAPQLSAARPDVDMVAIASRLREIETMEEGAAYLATQQLNKEGLLALAAELQLTRVDRLNQADLEKKILQQAIGSRRKFAGLGKW